MKQLKDNAKISCGSAATKFGVKLHLFFITYHKFDHFGPHMGYYSVCLKSLLYRVCAAYSGTTGEMFGLSFIYIHTSYV